MLTIETCPHYLFFTEEDMERIGAVAKCAPPLRPASDMEDLWDRLLQGEIDMVASDHSPSSPDLKQASDFFQVWGGIAGVQSRLAVLLEGGYRRRGLPLTAIARVAAETPARRFRMAGKGAICAGFDADLTLVDLSREAVLTPGDLQQRHPQTPYTGYTFRGTVVRTLLRGQTLYRGGHVVAARTGRFARPQVQEPT